MPWSLWSVAAVSVIVWPLWTNCLSAAPWHTAIAERRTHFRNKGGAVFKSYLFEIEISWAVWCFGFFNIPEQCQNNIYHCYTQMYVIQQKTRTHSQDSMKFWIMLERNSVYLKSFIKSQKSTSVELLSVFQQFPSVFMLKKKNHILCISSILLMTKVSFFMLSLDWLLHTLSSDCDNSVCSLCFLL